MRYKIILKSGKEIALTCKKIDLTMDEYGYLKSTEIRGVECGSFPIYMRGEEIAAITEEHDVPERP